jgi:hypothetical protein
VGHGDRVAGMQPVVGAVPLDGPADGGGTAVPQREGCGAFGGVAHPPHFRQLLGPGQVGAQLGEHAAAGLDRGELVGVADQHRLGPGLRCGGEELAQIVGADHARLVNDHHGGPVQFEGAVIG